MSEFLESVLFWNEPRIDLGISWISFVLKEPRIDLVISWISFVLKRTTNWSRNFLNQFCFKKNHELISNFLESILF